MTLTGITLTLAWLGVFVTTGLGVLCVPKSLRVSAVTRVFS